LGVGNVSVFVKNCVKVVIAIFYEGGFSEQGRIQDEQGMRILLVLF